MSITETPKTTSQQTATAYITKTIEGTKTSSIEAIVKPARRIGAIIRIGDTNIEQFTSLNITENYGTHHSMRLVVPSPNIKTEKGLTLEQAAKLIGELVEVTLTDVLNPAAPRHELKMIVTNIDVEQVKGNNRIVLSCYSPTYIAAVTPNFETMCNKNFDDIIKENCKTLETVRVKTKIKSAIKGLIPFVCRYNETSFAFIQRMSETYKQWFYFNGKELIVGEPETQTPIKLVYKENCDQLNMSMQLMPVHIGYQDYDSETHQPLEQPASKEAVKLGFWGTQVFNKSKKILKDEGFVYNPAVANKEILETVAKADIGSKATRIFQVKGKTDVYELKMCALASIQYHIAPEETDRMDVRIINVQHHLEADGTYFNNFVAIPAGATAPPSVGYLIPQTHTLEAEVISTDDPKGLGRIKACFLGPKSSANNRRTNWIRVATPDAGGGGDKVAKNRGLVCIPEVGSHVKIDFENGDPHSPYVASSMFHGKTGGGGGQGNNIKSLVTRTGTNITLNDGAHTAQLQTSSKNTINLEESGGKVTVKGDGEITLDSQGNTITLTTEGGTIKISSKISINIEAPTVNIGKAGGTININAKDINVNATNNNIKGSKNHIAGETTLDGGNVFIN